MRAAPQSGFAARIGRINVQGQPPAPVDQRDRVANSSAKSGEGAAMPTHQCSGRDDLHRPAAIGARRREQHQRSRSSGRKRGRFLWCGAAPQADAGARESRPRARADSGSRLETRPAGRGTSQSSCPGTLAVFNPQPQRPQRERKHSVGTLAQQDNPVPAIHDPIQWIQSPGIRTTTVEAILHLSEIAITRTSG